MPLILVASPGYLHEHGVPRTPTDIMQHACINVALPGGQRAQWSFVARNGDRRRVTVTPRGRLTIMDELDAVVEAAEAGLGLTVTSAENALLALRERTLLRIMEDYEVLGQPQMHSEIIIQYATKRLLPRRVRLLVDFLLEHLKGRDPLEIVGTMQPKIVASC